MIASEKLGGKIELNNYIESESNIQYKGNQNVDIESLSN